MKGRVIVIYRDARAGTWRGPWQEPDKARETFAREVNRKGATGVSIEWRKGEPHDDIQAIA